MTKFLIFTAAMYVLKNIAATDENLDPLSDEFINFINANQTLWRAGRNFRQGIPISYINLLAGTINDNSTREDEVLDDPPPYDIEITDAVLPENFDIRQRWPDCSVLNNVRDQGSCGSCWAVAAVGAMSDRFCISSQGKDNFYFAAADVLSCCLNCGSGCAGGVLKNAWLYYKRVGIVSGGEYDSQDGCQPYRVPPCDHHFAPNTLEPCGHNVKTPLCESTCQEHYKQSYGADKKKCKSVYYIKNNFVLKDIIYTRGPVTATFDVYADFLNYKSGVYRYVAGKFLGRHSVKLMGWGVENGVKYWLAANSWNDDWGNKGFFKILRDQNHCGIENTIIAGI
ncbi:cathepsin B-like [Ostrinia nubilalis]|uniref:cathepsin B-like n=1 Tax=Ostrinia nubilalis TaxID=29057 RepID=UPI00308259B3